MNTSIVNKTKKFRQDLEKLSREDLLEIIRAQDIETIKQINRIEWVFENKLKHLAWADGSVVENRPLTNRELSLLIDEPFELDFELLDMRNLRRTTKANTSSKRPVYVGKAIFGSRN